MARRGYKLWWYQPDAIIEVRAGRSTLEDPSRPGAGVEGRQGTTITGAGEEFRNNYARERVAS
jgi:hypothetical protein